MGGAMALAMVPGLPGRRGGKGGHASTTSHVSTDPAWSHKGEHRTEKTAHTDDRKADKKDDKKKDKKDDKDNGNGNDKSPQIFVPPADSDAFTRGVKHA
jgi:hypothetical protein